MATTDPVADMLTRIRNARLIGRSSVVIPASKLKIEVIKVLANEGYVGKYSLENDGATILVTLVNTEMKKIVRVSKPGRRVYVGAKEIPTVLQGHGLVILSTSKGVMSGMGARKAGLGGEIICKVW